VCRPDLAQAGDHERGRSPPRCDRVAEDARAKHPAPGRGDFREEAWVGQPSQEAPATHASMLPHQMRGAMEERRVWAKALYLDKF
jgi:hypothetical protein